MTACRGEVGSPCGQTQYHKPPPSGRPGFYELLEPQVQDIGTIDFPRVPEAMEIGYASTTQEASRVAGVVAQKIATAAIPGEAEAGFEAIQGKTRGGLTVSVNPKGEEIRVDELIIQNDTQYDDAVIESYVDIAPPTTITTLELSERLERLYGLGAFDLVTYRVEPGGRLVIVTQRRAAGNIEFRVGAAYEDSFDGRARIIFGGGVGFTQLDPLGRRVDIDAAIGTNQLAAVTFEQPLDYGQTWFATGEISYFAFRAPENESPEDRRADFFRRSVFAGVDLSYAPVETLRFLRRALLSFAPGRAFDRRSGRVSKRDAGR